MLAATALAVVGCGGAPVAPPPPPITVTLALATGADVNPDVENRASPLEVRVNELADTSQFASADFFALWGQESQTLAAGPYRRHEFMLAPNGVATRELTLDPAMQYVGVAAAFRDIRKASWRAVVPIVQDPKGQRTFQLDIRATGNTITAALQGKDTAGTKKK
jgi:type VI secretion system protein VasD